MRLIGIEEHFITPAVRDTWDAIGLGARDPGAAFHGGDVGRRLLDLAEERLALMDETGLDMQVLSGSVKNLGHYAASWNAGWPKRPSSTAALT